MELIQNYSLPIFLCLLASYVGALMFGAGAVAPMVIGVLGEKAGGPFLRAYWPRYHAIGVIGGLLITLLGLLIAAEGTFSGVFGGLVVLLAALMTVMFGIGWRLIPAINRARDTGQHERFDRLHRLDVGLVGIGILVGLGLTVALVTAMPGYLA